jgi:hypothetical protein
MNAVRGFSACPDGELVAEKVRQDLNLITKKLLQVYGRHISALILVGGFGRGEGAVVVDNGRVTPVNDYDLVMIVDQPCDLSRIGEIRRDLAQRLGVWWVDISTYTVAKLRRLRFTMYTYDLKYGIQVIHGDPSLLSLIPEMDPARMPLAEAEREFFTRLWCFLGPFSVEFLEQQPTDEEKFFLANQLSKALLACSDALLILNGLYHHSYAERLRRFEIAFKDRDDLFALVREATEFKLRPTRDIRYDVVERWFQVRRVFLDTMRDFVSQMYGRQFQHWPAYAWWYRNNPRQVLHRLAHVVVKRSLRYEKRIKVNLAQLFLLSAFEQRQVDTGLFDLAKRQLSSITGTDQPLLDWDAARGLATRLRMET